MTGQDPGGLGRRPPWRLILGVPIVIALLAMPWWGPRALSHLAFFRVRRIEILGTEYLPPGDILRRLNVDTVASVWAPTGPLEERIGSHPAVRTARVRRRLPGTLVVDVVESPPVALVPHETGLRAYDERGMLLPIDPSHADVDVPVLAQRDTALLRLLGAVRREAPAVFDRISQLRRLPRGDIALRIAATPVFAGADVTVDRLLELDPVTQDLARRQLRIAELDLRFRDQVIARLQ